MATAWNLVTTDGFDVEDVDNPRTLEGPCPGCARRVRFTERELVKNFRLLALSLVTLEKVRRVVQCPACDACFELPDTPPGDLAPARSGPPMETLKKIAELSRALARYDEEQALWKLRAELARKKGAQELAAEAQTLLEDFRVKAWQAREELCRLRGDPPPPPLAPAEPPAAMPAAPTPAAAEAPAVSAPLPAPAEAPPAPKEPPPEEDELAALKRKLKKKN
ncbi:MAG: hypothetical protein HY909_30245 [Deltaproteobacteria bacterium]|nr:hypothetical protein [Deltaproteobacteria bacterium]